MLLSFRIICCLSAAAVLLAGVVPAAVGLLAGVVPNATIIGAHRSSMLCIFFLIFILFFCSKIAMLTSSKVFSRSQANPVAKRQRRMSRHRAS
jgi:hypothetical protein